MVAMHVLIYGFVFQFSPSVLAVSHNKRYAFVAYITEMLARNGSRICLKNEMNAGQKCSSVVYAPIVSGASVVT